MTGILNFFYTGMPPGGLITVYVKLDGAIHLFYAEIRASNQML